MEPINIFIDGICIAGVTLEKSGVDFPVIDIVRDGNYITSYSPDQHILHFFILKDVKRFIYGYVNNKCCNIFVDK